MSALSVADIYQIDKRTKYYIMDGIDPKKLKFDQFDKSNIILEEFISYVYYVCYIEYCSDDKITKQKAFSEVEMYVSNIKKNILKKHVKNYLKLDQNKLDSEITYFEFFISTKFYKYPSPMLLSVLEFLTYHPHYDLIAIANAS